MANDDRKKDDATKAKGNAGSATKPGSGSEAGAGKPTASKQDSAATATKSGLPDAGSSAPADKNGDKSTTDERASSSGTAKDRSKAASATSSPAAAAADVPAPRKGRGRLILILVLVAFALGIAVWPVIWPVVEPYLPAQTARIVGLRSAADDGAIAALDARMSETRQNVTALRETMEARLDTLNNRVSDLEAAPSSNASESEALLGRIGTIEERLNDFAERLERQPETPDDMVSPDRISDLESRIENIAGEVSSLRIALSQGSGETLASDEAQVGTTNTALTGVLAQLPALDRRIAEMEGRMSETAAQDFATQDSVVELSDRLTRQLDTLASETTDRAQAIDALRAQLDGMDDAAALADARNAMAFSLAVSSLRSAADRGDGFADQLALARDYAPADAASVLVSLEAYAETGAATRDSLRQGFQSITDEIIAAGRRSGDEGWLGRTLDRLASLVTLRRVGEVEGDDADAIVARAEVRLAGGNLSAAVSELEALPEQAKPAAEMWLGEARGRLSLDDGLERLNRIAITAIGTGGQKRPESAPAETDASGTPSSSNGNQE